MNLSSCPYYRSLGQPDAQRGTCSFGCRDEPACITSEPEGGWGAVDAADYHEQHEAYLGTVADALTAAGFTVIDWYADPNDPRDGAIALEPVGAFAADELWLGWQEERGWTVLTVDKGKGWNKREQHAEDANNVFDVLVALLASPETVVREFARMAGVETTVPTDDFPDLDFPGHSSDDDADYEQFESALSAYRRD